MLSNRHVAEPWRYDQAAREAVDRGFRPIVVKMIGFLPYATEPLDVVLEKPHETADVALLRFAETDSAFAALELSNEPPSLGQAIMVVGYPAGIRALLARTDPAVVDSLLQAGVDSDFWEVARTLAAMGLVAPLVTRGIVGQITPTAIVYDAETTHGGSGGPVVTLDGRVIAVNTAIVSDFGGSNLGVPVAAARELLSEFRP
jgi:S1-C subfamily serine protease